MYPHDFLTEKGIRVGVFGNPDNLTLIIETSDSFQKVHLTHQEARRLAFKLMGNSDPYQEASAS